MGKKRLRIHMNISHKFLLLVMLAVYPALAELPKGLERDFLSYGYTHFKEVEALEGTPNDGKFIYNVAIRGGGGIATIYSKTKIKTPDELTNFFKHSGYILQNQQ